MAIRFNSFAFLILSGLLIISCKKNSEKVSLEETVWVESKDKKDTLVFLKEGSLLLNRPKEIRGGHLLPQLGDGSYFYKELKDSIFLHHAVSSYYGTTNYAFKMESNTLYIGDFYNKSGKLLIFKKIR